MIKHLFEQYSEAWYQIRLGRVTATHFKDLMSAKDTLGYQSLIANIAAEIITEEIENQETYTNAAMEHGTETEPIARQLYEEIYNVKIEQVGFVTPDEDNEFYSWIGVSPDGLIGDDGGLEIKCPLRKTHLSYIEANKMPTTYLHQVQSTLFVTGRKWWDFMSYCDNMKPFIIRVYPDVELHLKYQQKLQELKIIIDAKIQIYNKYKFK